MHCLEREPDQPMLGRRRAPKELGALLARALVDQKTMREGIAAEVAAFTWLIVAHRRAAVTRVLREPCRIERRRLQHAEPEGLRFELQPVGQRSGFRLGE